MKSYYNLGAMEWQKRDAPYWSVWNRSFYYLLHVKNYTQFKSPFCAKDNKRMDGISMLRNNLALIKITSILRKTEVRMICYKKQEVHQRKAMIHFF